MEERNPRTLLLPCSLCSVLVPSPSEGCTAAAPCLLCCFPLLVLLAWTTRRPHTNCLHQRTPRRSSQHSSALGRCGRKLTVPIKAAEFPLPICKRNLKLQNTKQVNIFFSDNIYWSARVNLHVTAITLPQCSLCMNMSTWISQVF